MRLTNIQTTLEHVPDGVVKVRRDGAWMLVLIGRAGRVKKFNLTVGEAAELARVIGESGITASR